MSMARLFTQVAIGLAENPEALNILEKELALPNIPLPVVDGEIFWTTLAECNGWKLQQNTFTRSARILNSEGIRIAWGTINGMEKALDRIVKYSKKYN